MQKVANVGSILVDVRGWYQANDMSEDDLSSDLRSVLKSLQTYVPLPFFALVLGP